MMSKGDGSPPADVYSARLRELSYLQQRQVYSYSTVEEAKKVTGRRPLRLKWIDTNKGGDGALQIRSRLVCTEVRPKGKEAIFSATPPLESLRLLVSYLSSQNILMLAV